MTALKVIVFLGTVRENRAGKRVADFIINHLKNTNHSVDLFDPVDFKFPVIAKPLHFYQDRAEAPKWLIDADQKIREADAFIIVSGEYNCTIPPALTNMMDHFPPASYAYRPSGIVTYSAGGFGGCRAAVALRPFLLEIQTPSCPATLTVPSVTHAIEPDGTPNKEQAERLNKNALKLIAQVDWYAEAMRNQRNSKGVPQ